MLPFENTVFISIFKVEIRAKIKQKLIHFIKSISIYELLNYILKEYFQSCAPQLTNLGQKRCINILYVVKIFHRFPSRILQVPEQLFVGSQLSYNFWRVVQLLEFQAVLWTCLSDQQQLQFQMNFKSNPSSHCKHLLTLSSSKGS